MPVIQVENLTKDYGHNRGVFDATFAVEKGQVYGFLGPNGAGKTTTIRHIMGFSKPQKGRTLVNGQDSWTHYHKIQQSLGYLPGEIALPERLTGTQFIKMMADLRGLTDMAYTQVLIRRFELQPAGGLKRMALGMKRKLAIVTAFMHDPDILVLDEPTSGLDPIMQETFIEFIKSEKQRGKTILLSSHIFSEVDATCDKITIIKDGRLVSTIVADNLRHMQTKTYKLEFAEKPEYDRFIASASTLQSLEISRAKEARNQAHIQVHDNNINECIAAISEYKLNFFTEIKFTLEDYFMKFYDKGQVM